MFYDSKSYATYVIPTVISRLYKPSLELLQEAKRKDEEQKRLAKSKVESWPKSHWNPHRSRMKMLLLLKQMKGLWNMSPFT